MAEVETRSEVYEVTLRMNLLEAQFIRTMIGELSEKAVSKSLGMDLVDARRVLGDLYEAFDVVSISPLPGTRPRDRNGRSSNIVLLDEFGRE